MVLDDSDDGAMDFDWLAVGCGRVGGVSDGLLGADDGHACSDRATGAAAAG